MLKHGGSNLVHFPFHVLFLMCHFFVGNSRHRCWSRGRHYTAPVSWTREFIRLTRPYLCSGRVWRHMWLTHINHQSEWFGSALKATSGNPPWDWRTLYDHRNFAPKLRLSHDYKAFDLNSVHSLKLVVLSRYPLFGSKPVKNLTLSTQEVSCYATDMSFILKCFTKSWILVK